MFKVIVMNVRTGVTATTAVKSSLHVIVEQGQALSWFKSIPPERIGINGEYDYYGLAKRVRYHLRSHAEIPLSQIKVRQRGRVIVLLGSLSCPYMVQAIRKLVLSVDGVDEVETRGLLVKTAG